MRPYHVVVFGATGFTGSLVVKYLAEAAPKEIEWAIAGRDESKLRSVASSLGRVRPPRTCRRLCSRDFAFFFSYPPLLLFGGVSFPESRRPRRGCGRCSLPRAPCFQNESPRLHRRPLRALRLQRRRRMRSQLHRLLRHHRSQTPPPFLNGARGDPLGPRDDRRPPPRRQVLRRPHRPLLRLRFRPLGYRRNGRVRRILLALRRPPQVHHRVCRRNTRRHKWGDDCVGPQHV